MNADWTHSICELCWRFTEPSRVPVTVREPYRQKETCCFCGWTTLAGIYVRKDPAVTEFCAHDANAAVDELLDDPVALHTLAANLALLEPGSFS